MKFLKWYSILIILWSCLHWLGEFLRGGPEWDVGIMIIMIQAPMVYYLFKSKT